MKAIVVSFDRLNASFLGCYGNLELPTPHWDRLAAESVVFDQHFGENFDPDAPTHAWWTGCYLFPRPPQLQTQLPRTIRLLRRAGVRTQLVWHRGSRIAASAVDDFDESDRIDDKAADETAAIDGGVCATPASPTTPASTSPLSGCSLAALDAVAARSVQRWNQMASDKAQHGLLWIALPGLLSPAEESPETNTIDDGGDSPRSAPTSPAADSFRQAVVRLDEFIGRLYQTLLSTDAPADTGHPSEPLLWIVTAAAGVALPEATDFRGFPLILNESLIHTPLLVGGPVTERQRGRTQRLVQTVDLGPSLRDWFGWDDAGPKLEGRSWLPLVRAERTDWRTSICLGCGLKETAIRTDDFYLVVRDAERWFCDSSQPDTSPQPGDSAVRDAADAGPAEKDATEGADDVEDDLERRCRLFVKPEDVWNVNDVAEQFPDDAARLRKLLRQFIAAARSGTP